MKLGALMMKSVTALINILLVFVALSLPLSLSLVTGCDVPGSGKKAAKVAHQDLVKVQAIARVGVNPKEFAKVLEKARISTTDAISKFGETDELRIALQRCLDGYMDAKKILEVKGEVDTKNGTLGNIVKKYGVRAPSRFVLQFGVVQKIFETTNKAVDVVGGMVK